MPLDIVDVRKYPASATLGLFGAPDEHSGNVLIQPHCIQDNPRYPH
jgi:hypothetical protein